MRFPFTILAIALAAQTFAQTWPTEMRLSPDGRMLTIGNNAPAGFYNDTVVRALHLTFTQPDYWSLMQNNYTSKTDIPATLVVDGVTYDSVGVRFKGQTSYTQSGTTQKKSFNISLDYVHGNQNVMGYKTLNLNNCYQDESFLREVFYTRQIRKHIPSAKANFVKLYINGENWGVYPNVQQLNKQFLKEWFMTNNGTNWRADSPNGPSGSGSGGPQWGDGTAAMNYLGNDTNTYKQYYTLKSTDDPQPWNLLMTAAHALDTVSNTHMESVLNNYFDVDRILWHLASEIAWADDDSYVYKGKMDYYVYHELETGRMTLLEYDGNSTMEPNRANWNPLYNANNANYPLLNRLLNQPQLRQRYLAHLRTVIADEMAPSECNALLDWYQNLIDTMVQNDPKKIYSYNQFVSEVDVLKNFINTRRSNLLNNTEVAQAGPVITDAAYYSNDVAWEQPVHGQPVNVRATVTSIDGISGVTLYYSNSIVGKFFRTEMYDDGQHDDGAAGDGVYGATIPPQAGGTWVRWYIEAAANNAAKTVSYLPAGAEHNVYVYEVSTPTGVAAVALDATVDLYPNPANNIVNIKTGGASNGLVEIVNAVGQVMKVEPTRDVLTVDFSALPNGLYFIRYGSATKKLVIAR